MDFNGTMEQTGQPAGGIPPEPEKKKKSGLAIAGIVLAAVLVVAIAVSVAAYVGVFGGNAGKVAKAFTNTFREQPAVIQDFSDSADITAGGQYTTVLELGVEDLDLNMECRVDGNDKQFAGNIESGITNIEFKGALTEEELMVYIPFLGDYNFCYNYREVGTGYLLEEMSEEEIQALNKGLEILYDPRSIDGEDVSFSWDEWLESMSDSLKETEFEVAGTETFEIDGKEVEGKGYRTTLKQEEMEEALDLIEEEFNAQYEELYDLMSEIDPSFENPYQETFDETRRIIEELSDFDLTFYIYDRQLAAIIAQTQDGDQLRILFQGGERRTQNMAVEVVESDADGISAKTELFAITGNTEGTTETMNFAFGDELTLVFTYDSETGAYEIGVDDEMVISGEISFDRTGLTITMTEDFSEYIEDMVMEGSISMRKGVEMEEIEGERFDIGNADEDEWEELINEVTYSMYGF